MKAMRTAVLILLAAIVGCDEPVDDVSAKSDGPAANTRRRPAPPSGVKSPAETKTPAGRREVAKAGVGKEGRDYKILKSLGQIPRTRQWKQFIQLQEALKYYKIRHERYPSSMEELEEKILKPNFIKLPELPAGDKYVFDSEKGQLMVEHPPK